MCSKKINLCGVKATPPCYKRHVQKVPVTSLRPPAAFQMLEIETATTDGRERHRSARSYLNFAPWDLISMMVAGGTSSNEDG